MKELELSIRKNGFDYEQVARTAFGYVYSQRSEGKIIAYEVFRRKENTQFNCISFPGNEAFGSWSWTYKNITEALHRLNQLAAVKEPITESENALIQTTQNNK